MFSIRHFANRIPMSFKKPLLPTSQLIQLFSPSSKRRSSVLSRVPRIPVSRNNVLDRLNERIRANQSLFNDDMDCEWSASWFRELVPITVRVQDRYSLIQTFSTNLQTANCEFKADEIDVKIRLWTHNHQHHRNPPLTTLTTPNHPNHRFTLTNSTRPPDTLW